MGNSWCDYRGKTSARIDDTGFPEPYGLRRYLQPRSKLLLHNLDLHFTLSQPPSLLARKRTPPRLYTLEYAKSAKGDHATVRIGVTPLYVIYARFSHYIFQNTFTGEALSSVVFATNLAGSHETHGI
jgi:hypothetical protein